MNERELAKTEWWFRHHGMPQFVDSDDSRSRRAAGVPMPLIVGAIAGVAASIPFIITDRWISAWVIPLIVALIAGFLQHVFGLTALFRWGVKRTRETVSEAQGAATRSLPLLLSVVTFFFLSAETWQIFADLEGLGYGISLSLFLVAGMMFIARSVDDNLDAARTFSSWEQVESAAGATPASDLVVRFDGAPEPVPLKRLQRANVLLISVISQTLLASVVAIVIGVFFLGFGLSAVDTDVVAGWLGHEPSVVWSISTGRGELEFTRELIRVAGFIATFSGFYFAVFSSSDATLREGITADTEESLREAFAARQLYLAAIEQDDDER